MQCLCGYKTCTVCLYRLEFVSTLVLCCCCCCVYRTNPMGNEDTLVSINNPNA